MRVAEVKAAAAEFSTRFHLLLRRELAAEFPGAVEHERVMDALDRVAERLPHLLPEAFQEAA
jgi:hypothetical protein